MKAKYVICLTFHPNGALLTGDSNGTIYLWHKDGNTIAHTITHAHNVSIQGSFKAQSSHRPR